MKAIKRMLTGLMLMLTAILAAVGDGSRGSWMGGAGFVLLLMALAMFVLGLFTKEENKSLCTADGGHGAPAAALFLQQLYPLAPVGHVALNERVERGGVVVVADVRELVDDDIVDGFARILHQPPGKADAVFAAA